MRHTTPINPISGSYVGLSGSTVAAFSTPPNGYSLDEKEYIKQVLITEIEGVLKGYKWLAFSLLTAGIEFLGLCLDDKAPFETSIRGLSEDRFRLAIRELFPKQYSQFNHRLAASNSKSFDLYNELRCGVNHTTFPTPRIGLSERANNAKHLSVINGKLVLVAEDFYEDFKQACLEVIRRLGAGKVHPKIGLKFGQ